MPHHQQEWKRLPYHTQVTDPTPYHPQGEFWHLHPHSIISHLHYGCTTYHQSFDLDTGLCFMAGFDHVHRKHRAVGYMSWGHLVLVVERREDEEWEFLLDIWPVLREHSQEWRCEFIDSFVHISNPDMVRVNKKAFLTYFHSLVD